ncbi:MAG: ABC transporter permease [Candidatus Omnitrophica bacterium]|nr:ABC transporter permease [Candidatus Omnitrophota bacterium]
MMKKITNLKRIKAVAKKEFIQIRRDPRSLALAFLIPVILLILFGFALTLDVDNVPMAIWNQDNSQFSRDFILNFSNSKYFKIVGYFDNYKKMEYLMDRNKVMIIMVIPKDFSHYLTSGKTAPLQIITDGSDSNTATIAMGYIRSVVQTYNMQLLTRTLGKQGKILKTLIDFRPRIWFNQDLLNKYFVVPGLIAIIMMIIAALLTSLTIAREWERGTMEQLISTPVKADELIIGKFIPYFVIGFVDLLIAIIMTKYVFMVPLEGNIFLLIVLSSLFLTGALGLGIFISTVAKSQLMASQMAMLVTFIPTFLLSGFTYPIYNMPQVIQYITYLIPARYFITIVRGIFLKGDGLSSLWDEALLLLIFAILMAGVAIKKFEKKIVVQ